MCYLERLQIIKEIFPVASEKQFLGFFASVEQLKKLFPLLIQREFGTFLPGLSVPVVGVPDVAFFAVKIRMDMR